MKTHLLTLSLAAVMLFSFVGCNDDDPVWDPIPAAPQGVTSVTGDGAVYVFWNGPYERDIAGYQIWRSLEPVDNYVEIGQVQAVANSNLDLLIYEYIDQNVANGVTYYYAVSTFDLAGQSSDLSAEEVYDTPRPDGEVVLFDYQYSPSLAGYDFSAYNVVSFDYPAADVFVDRVDDVYYLNAFDTDTDLQDMGYTDDFDEIGWAPTDGWSANGWLELVLGHTYIIWTRDLHFAKMRVISINSNSVMFEWAYQTDTDNPELAPGVPSVPQKPAHGPEYLRSVVIPVSK